MIYSMTMFFNEHDLIDLKIKEESPHVDRIIVQESLWSHAGLLKPICFDAVKYKDNKKVSHLIIDDPLVYEKSTSDDDSTTSRAATERNYPLNKFGIEDDDILIVADIDEIINSEAIPRIIKETQRRGFVRLEMRAFYYYINVMQADKWSYPYAVTGKIAKKFGLNWLRLNMIGTILPDCGSHFGWLGGAEAIRFKLKNMAHTQFATKDIDEGIEERLQNLKDVVGRDLPPLRMINIDHLYPATILNDYAKWKKHICNKESQK